MKALRYLLGFALMVSSSALFAQTDEATTSKIVENRNYKFIATSANPLASAELNKVLSSMNNGMGSTRINLTGSNYDFKVTKDSVEAYLPFYGRTFNAPINTSEGGIKFKSKDFSYKQTVGKKGNYIITIKTNDLKNDNYTIILNISKAGYASLSTNSNNKQAISFDGILAEPEIKK